MYGLLMLLPAEVLTITLILPKTESVGVWGAVLVIGIPLVLAYLFFLKIGEKIFEFTELKYSEHKLTANHAHMWAEITEFTVFFAVVLSVTFIPVFIEKYIHG